MVYRVYVEKKRELAHEAQALGTELREFLGITGIKDLRVINRYDAEHISEEAFTRAKETVFSEPQVDILSDELVTGSATVFAVEYLPGQFDQRADSAMQCIRIMAPGEEPVIRTAKIYVIEGCLGPDDVDKIKQYVINPVEAREASLDKPATLVADYETPESVAVMEGFCSLSKQEGAELIRELGLAMDEDDLMFCREYFRCEKRDPTITEIRVIDTYWSDHCRHTTFLTEIDNVVFEDQQLQETYDQYLSARSELGRTKPVCLMDIGTIAAKVLKSRGLLDKLDESEEVNACTVRTEITVGGERQPWLLFFKNETHNHPTEIEPFGGAATCIGGAIRDPLSGRSYVYGAMRLTGAGDPRTPQAETLEGKLSQRTIVTKAAAGYSSYGNQIGLATGLVDEIYHPGYVAKHMEVGAVIGSAPSENVRREEPTAGDAVILLGGATGRDGIGGATGSSKAHTSDSLATCGAEVQKGNAPEERKLQRLFRQGDVCRMIKRCNDFGAGGVSVAIGELAEGLDIYLDKVPKKYEGLDGTELAISESQERMAVVVAAGDVEEFLHRASQENLAAVKVADVTETGRMTMTWESQKIVDLSREFLDSNGASKHQKVRVSRSQPFEQKIPHSFAYGMMRLVRDINTCSRRGLAERFDSTIGAGSVLMPFGGDHQLTPAQAMVHKIATGQDSSDVSLMAYGYDPYVAEKSPYHGAYTAVVESVSKLIATGAGFSDVYLSFQEFFGTPRQEPSRWGQPMAALLGAFQAQMDLETAAIGGKDSMSGSFEDLDVPPTLISFAVTTGQAEEIISPEFKRSGHPTVVIEPIKIEREGWELPDKEGLKAAFRLVEELNKEGHVKACMTPAAGGIAGAVMQMCFGNGIGFAYEDSISMEDIFSRRCGSFIAEIDDEETVSKLLIRYGRETGHPFRVRLLGRTQDERYLCCRGDKYELSALLRTWEETLADVYPLETGDEQRVDTLFCVNTQEADSRIQAPAVLTADRKPRILIPVFPGTNCEFDSANAVRAGGSEAEEFMILNRSAQEIEESASRFAQAVRASEAVFIPGGFSGGDEPDGSGKFITAFFRNEAVRDAVTELLEQRDGLMLGICNGFQALIKLGLVPFGKIVDTDETCPTLTFNTIGRHQSRIVRTRIVTNRSPWLSLTAAGDVYHVPVSHGEGRFLANDEWLSKLTENGQIATQYVDGNGEATMDIRSNPNGSVLAVEGITSPDGRVLGKMGHSERIGRYLYRNVPGRYDSRIFEAATRYFTGR